MDESLQCPRIRDKASARGRKKNPEGARAYRHRPARRGRTLSRKEKGGERGNLSGTKEQLVEGKKVGALELVLHTQKGEEKGARRRAHRGKTVDQKDEAERKEQVTNFSSARTPELKNKRGKSNTRPIHKKEERKELRVGFGPACCERGNNRH